MCLKSTILRLSRVWWWNVTVKTRKGEWDERQKMEAAQPQHWWWWWWWMNSRSTRLVLAELDFKMMNSFVLTSESGPLSAPGQEKVTNSWQRLWTTKQHTVETGETINQQMLQWHNNNNTKYRLLNIIMTQSAQWQHVFKGFEVFALCLECKHAGLERTLH